MAWRARHVRHRQRARLRPGVGEVPRARCRPGLPRTGRGLDLPRLDLELPSSTTWGTSRRPPTGVQVAVPRRGSQRFPELRFLFLEGGVGWARSLLADLTGHWEKRSLAGLARDSDPRLADVDLFLDLVRAVRRLAVAPTTARRLARRWEVNPEDPTDSFARLRCRRRGRAARAVRRALLLRVRGRRPRDASAFDAAAQSRGRAPPARRSAPTSATGTCRSWSEVLEEVYEPVEDGRIDDDDLRDFVFANPVRLWTSANPHFFAGHRRRGRRRRRQADAS